MQKGSVVQAILSYLSRTKPIQAINFSLFRFVGGSVKARKCDKLTNHQATV